MDTKENISPQLVQKTAEEEYKWSFIRVAEGVTVNVASALIISVTGLLLLTIPSAFILFIQHAFHFLIVSTDILEIVLIIGLTIIGTLLIIALILYWRFHNKPWTILLTLVGAMIGTIMDARGVKIDDSFLAKMQAAAKPQQNDPPAQTQQQ